ncbi:hypothetical protein L905_07020 [Agrobacterium sp. TS43]|nr:hypothetical protein L905_07020 [Agrobacterium sp. TS43]KVK62946.1 hypothetical protein L906_17800 [Agrobacterium sp. TS45]KVK67469.1 hypothetical protein L907_17765 [Agrobacterium sp. C13]
MRNLRRRSSATTCRSTRRSECASRLFLLPSAKSRCDLFEDAIDLLVGDLHLR